MRHIDQQRATQVPALAVLSAAGFWRNNCKKAAAVESILRESEALLVDTNRTHANLERASGTIVCFVPAHGDSRAGSVAAQLSRALTEGLGRAVLLADFDARSSALWNSTLRSTEAPRRLDGRTWGAFVTEVDGMDVLDAREIHPRQLGRLLDHARERYSEMCVDLTGARAPHALEVLRASDAIFLVTDCDYASLEGVREKAEWLRSIDLSDRVGLLVRRSADSPDLDQVEDFTGLPVCSLIETDAQIGQLGRWLASVTASGVDQEAAYAIAV
jgi:Flp pilus assembly CpaE family ATPase